MLHRLGLGPYDPFSACASDDPFRRDEPRAVVTESLGGSENAGLRKLSPVSTGRLHDTRCHRREKRVRCARTPWETHEPSSSCFIPRPSGFHEAHSWTPRVRAACHESCESLAGRVPGSLIEFREIQQPCETPIGMSSSPSRGDYHDFIPSPSNGSADDEPAGVSFGVGVSRCGRRRVLDNGRGSRRPRHRACRVVQPARRVQGVLRLLGKGHV